MRSGLDIKGFDDKDLHKLVEIRLRHQHRIGGGAGVAQLDLFHRADGEVRGIVASQAGGDHQIAAQQLAVRREIVQPQPVLTHQGEVPHRQPQVLGAEHLGADRGVRVHQGEDGAPVEAHFTDHAHQGIGLVDDAVAGLHPVVRAHVQRQGGGPVGDGPLRHRGGLQLQVIGGDITAVLCLMFVCIFESCIYCGLIQTNTGYEQLFEVCTMGAQITDLKYHVCYASSNAMELPKTIMKESAKKEVVVDKKTVIKGRPIQGGYVLWQEDIKDILMLLEKMEENRKTIEESNCIEQENYQTKAKINMLREKNRLYDKLQMQTAEQIELLNNLLYQYEAETNFTAKRRLLAKISVIGTYIKRCGNLIFIEERAEVSDIAELEACLEESFSSLRLMGVMCAFAAPSGAFIYVRDAVRIYNFFETVIEACLDSLLSVWVKFRVHKESLIFCMEVESNANLTSFFEITDTSSYEDGVWRFTFTVKKAGEA